MTFEKKLCWCPNLQANLSCPVQTVNNPFSVKTTVRDIREKSIKISWDRSFKWTVVVVDAGGAAGDQVYGDGEHHGHDQPLRG
jgi:hypothetical protein